MTGLFIIAHAPLASALQAVAAHAFPDLAQALVVYDVPAGSDLATYEAEAEARLAVFGDAEVLILTDVVGASPANLAGLLARRGRRRALAGLNVPMLWRALNYRQMGLDELLTRARDGAVGSIQPVTIPVPQNQALQGRAHDPQQRHHQQ